MKIKILLPLIAAMSVQAQAMNEIFINKNNDMATVYAYFIEKNKYDKTYVDKVLLAEKKLHEFLEAQSDFLYYKHPTDPDMDCRYGYELSMERAILQETKYEFWKEEDNFCSGVV